MEAFPRRTENRVEGEVVLWGNRRILFLKIFAITDGGSSHYQDVRKAASLCSSYMVEMKSKRLSGNCGGRWTCLLCPRRAQSCCGGRWEVETWEQGDGVELIEDKEGGGVNHVQGRGQGLDVGDHLVMEDLS